MNAFTRKLIKTIRQPERLFVMLSLLFGICFLLAIPPLQTPDETAHFLRAYEISEAELVTPSDSGVTGAYLPSSLSNMIETVENKQKIQFNPDVKYMLTSTKAALDVPLKPENKKFYDLSVTAAYTPVGYLPQSIAIAIGRFISMPPILLLYFARVAILAAWVILGYLSIKALPFKKWGLTALLLFPMFVAQSISVGVDAVSIGASALFIALVLKNYNNRRIKLLNYMSILIVATIMVTSKQTLFILLPLVPLINYKDNFQLFTHRFKESFLALWPQLAIIIVPLLLIALWSLINGDVSKTSSQIASNQDSNEQIRFLLQHPAHFLKALFLTFFFGWGDTVVESVIGIFGWSDTRLSELFLVIGYIAITIILLTGYKETKIKITPLLRAMFGLLALIYAVTIFGVLYLIYSPVGYNIILGVQGRYLLPALIMLIPVCYGFAVTTKRHYITLSFSLVGTLFVVSIATIIFRYYITLTY